MAQPIISIFGGVGGQFKCGKEELSLLKSDFEKRIETIIEALKVLGNHGWKWTAKGNTIHLFKDISNKEAISEIKKLGLTKLIQHNLRYV